MASAKIVPIDFGTGIDLRVSKLILFRLTKCFTKLADSVGYEGNFKKSMIISFDIFADNIQLIADYS